MTPRETAANFERVALVHLDAAYNLARWITRNDHDAQDVVQEAFLRGLRAFDTFRGGDARAWLLTIVRNTAFTRLGRAKAHEPLVELDEEACGEDEEASDPQLLLERAADVQRVRAALEALPVEFREATVLREIEGLSYKEIAAVTGVPMGTVMSRLARGRRRLAELLAGDAARAEE